MNRWRYEYGRLGSNQAKAEWVVAREKIYNERQKVGVNFFTARLSTQTLMQMIDACVIWMGQIISRTQDEYEKSHILGAFKTQHLYRIVERLVCLGWGEEIALVDPRNLRLYRGEHHEITERGERFLYIGAQRSFMTFK